MTKRLFLAIALSILLHAPLARAADPVDSEMVALGESSAPLLALPLSEAPGASFVITAEEIEHSGAANIFELLRRVPGVDIRYTPMSGHIGIRSTGASPFSEGVLLLIDGSPYNSPDKGGVPRPPELRRLLSPRPHRPVLEKPFSVQS
jgi:iron complex outermembrane receptor protein/vitamin B12 transporter